MDEVVDLLIEGLTGNPFSTPLAVRRRAAEAFDEVDRSSLAYHVARYDDPARLEKRVLAFGHREAQQSPDELHNVLQPPTLPAGFRNNIYQRLARNIIRLPSLRDRREDIESIASAFIRRYLPKGTLDALCSDVLYWLRSLTVRDDQWPGNVRELQHVIRSRLMGLDAPLYLETRVDTHDEALPTPLRDCIATMSNAGTRYLRRVVHAIDGNLARAARILGVDRATIRCRLESSVWEA